MIFTSAKAIIGDISRFWNLNRTFSPELNTDSESALETKSNESSFELI